MQFAEILSELIEQHGVTIYTLYRDIGLDQSMVRRWLQEGRMPSAENLIKLADYFGVSIDYLVGRSDDRGSVSQSGDNDDDEDDDVFEYAALDGRIPDEATLEAIKRIVREEIERERGARE